MICVAFYTVGTVIVAVSTNLGVFFAFRALTALFGTASFTVGVTIVADIYPPVQRGTNMSIVLFGSTVGPTLGPFLGGVIVTYTSWRIIFVVLAALGGISLGLSVFFLPETGMDLIHSKLLTEKNQSTSKKVRFIFVPINPLRVITVLKFPNLAIAGFGSMAVAYNMYSTITAIRNVIDARFNLTTPIISALFYIPLGMGYVVGSTVGGIWADFYVKKYIKKRGRRVPEDRLHSAVLSLGILIPGSALIYGWCLEKQFGGKALPIVALFIQGFSQTLYFPSVNAYCVDCFPSFGAILLQAIISLGLSLPR